MADVLTDALEHTAKKHGLTPKPESVTFSVMFHGDIADVEKLADWWRANYCSHVGVSLQHWPTCSGHFAELTIGLWNLTREQVDEAVSKAVTVLRFIGLHHISDSATRRQEQIDADAERWDEENPFQNDWGV